ncbi:DUF6603 domain-containing protein [Micromonospora sp. CPCC 205711]|uniref:DUF6603 domain-containing protein n=1 Tax=Micromonospora sp. CPCC 205547 TaxID=3122400 RepID=UPI002FEF3FC1
MTAGSTAERALIEVSHVLEPLAAALTTPEELTRFLSAFGMRISEAEAQSALGAGAADRDLLGRLAAALDDLARATADHEPTLDDLRPLLVLAPDVLGTVTRLPQLLSGIAQRLPAGFVTEVFDRLLATYLNLRHEMTHAIAVLLGLIEYRPVTAGSVDPAARELDYLRVVVHWPRLAALLNNPPSVLTEVYGWGGAGLAHNELLLRLQAVAQSVDVAAVVEDLEAPLIAALWPAGAPTDPPVAVRVPIWTADDDEVSAIAGILLTGAGVSVAGAPPGFAVMPFVSGEVQAQIPLGAAVALEVTGAADLAGGPVAAIRPGGFEVSVVGPVLGADSRAGIGVRRLPAPGHDVVTLLDAAGVGLTATSLALTLTVTGSDVGVALEVTGGRLGVLPSGDGFLTTVLPADGFTVPFELSIAWSARHGLRISGGAGLQRDLPVGLQLGPLGIDRLLVALAANESGISLELGAGLSLKLGPLSAVVDRIGLTAELIPGVTDGNLGPAQLALGFKPPSGVGLAIDSPAVSGGGFLMFDPDKEQYAGGLHLTFEKLTLNAIGLLTTHLPDGSRGFSLLVIVQASGFTPIQLGFGFTLNAVGGLLGINRTVAVDVLRAGVRNRTLDAILFSPDDPTPRAAQLVSALQSVFPPAVDQYVFGPMAMIGWGAPVTLVTIELALILELPAPVRLIVLGRIRAALPDPEHPIVSINLDVVGVVDFDRSELSVDATLYDSMVGPFALTGDMAARANWGAKPDFVMAVGGFHPAYRPPAGFPALRRLTLALSAGTNPRLRMETYFALTSNTVQMGARLELSVQVGGFSLEGNLGFDTLIQFAPFRLLAEIYAQLALKRGASTLMGLNIHVHLTGPSPWVLWGEATFKIFFVSFSLPFRAQFGRAEDAPVIERQEVWPILRDSLTADANWSAQLPAQSGQLVVLRDGAGDGELTAHPLGALTVSQQLVPLERTLGLFGSVPPRDYDRFAVVAAGGLDIVGPATEHFAPAQFRQMSDAEKLASPPYERMISGVRLAPHTAITVGYVQDLPLDYEQSVILDIDEPTAERLEERYSPGGGEVTAAAQYGPAGTAPSREQGRAKFAPPASGPAVAEPTWVVVDRDTLNPVPLDGLDGSYTAAAERLRARADRDELQIVRAEELELV